MTTLFTGEWRPVYLSTECQRIVVGYVRRVVIAGLSWYECGNHRHELLVDRRNNVRMFSVRRDAEKAVREDLG